MLDCDEYTLRWLTDDGLQGLTESSWESSSSTDGDLDDCVLLELGARWANKSLRYDELQRVQMRVWGANVGGVQTLQFLNSMASYSNVNWRFVATTRRLQELLNGLLDVSRYS